MNRAISEIEYRRRMLSDGIEKSELELRAARAAAEREELYREFVFELAAKELGRETAMRMLNRVRLVEDVAAKVEGVKLEGLPKP